MTDLLWGNSTGVQWISHKGSGIWKAFPYHGVMPQANFIPKHAWNLLQQKQYQGRRNCPLSPLSYAHIYACHLYLTNIWITHIHQHCICRDNTISFIPHLFYSAPKRGHRTFHNATMSVMEWAISFGSSPISAQGFALCLPVTPYTLFWRPAKCYKTRAVCSAGHRSYQQRIEFFNKIFILGKTEWKYGESSTHKWLERHRCILSSVANAVNPVSSQDITFVVENIGKQNHIPNNPLGTRLIPKTTQDTVFKTSKRYLRRRPWDLNLDVFETSP